jgi:hypothetical protein
VAPNRSGLASPARLKKEGIALGELEGEIEALRSDGSLPKFGDLIREMGRYQQASKGTRHVRSCVDRHGLGVVGQALRAVDELPSHDSFEPLMVINVEPLLRPTYLTPVLARTIPHNRLQCRGVGSHIDEPS